MPAQTDPKKPVIPEAEEIYDTIMNRIEPELSSAQIDTLKEKYKNETPEEKKVRGKRYKTAFEKYDKEFVTYMKDLHQKVTDYRKHTFERIEYKEREKEEKKMKELDALIQKEE